jgi:hypothetical protein
METEKTEWAAMLADAEAKKVALDELISSIKKAMALGAVGRPGDITIQPSAGSLVMGQPIDLPVGAFMNKSLPAAIKLYLSAVKKKQTTQQIAAALKEGGVETTASNFEPVVTGALWRLKGKEVLRFKDGWGLAEHYPEHIRKSVSQGKRSPGKKKTKRTPKTKSKKDASPKASVVVPISKGLEQRIETVLKSDTDKSFSPAEIAKLLNVNIKGVPLALGRMAVKHMAEKCGDGKYRAPREKAQKAG